MREILFRGKQKSNGNWVHGDLSYHRDGRMFIRCWDRLEFDPTYNAYEVNPETVGQFTGLTDKNGKTIFEGDLVKAERICNGDAWVGTVVWWNGCFAIQGVKDKNIPAIDLFRGYEVIGNIHDNPELLEG